MRSLAAALGLAAGAVAAPNLAESVLLTDYVASTGARCLDGTPPRFWLQRASNPASATKWSIHHMGGGWCESTGDCAARAFSPDCYLGSTNASCFLYRKGDEPPGTKFNETMDFASIPSCLNARWCGGLMNSDAARNSVSSDWNKVLLQYCDGSSYTGDLDSPVTTQFNGSTVTLYYRGMRNWRATFAELVRAYGFADATDVLVSGDSAGGLATYYHADRIAEYAPRARVTAAPDSGYFLGLPSYPAWQAALGWVMSNGNGTGGLTPGCVAAMRARGRDPLECRFPEVAVQHMRVPTFVMNSIFDPALDSISAGIGQGNATAVNAVAAQVVESVVANALADAKNAAFLHGCAEHCGAWAQQQGGLFPDFNATIDGASAIDALVAFRAGGARRLWLHNGSFPCATCCSGGSQ